MFEKCHGRSFFEFGPEAVHGQVECRVIVFDGGEKARDLYVGTEFFFDLADDRVFEGFAGLDFAAGELPAVHEVSVTSLGCEDLTIFGDNGGHYFDCFHALAPLRNVRSDFS